MAIFTWNRASMVPKSRALTAVARLHLWYKNILVVHLLSWVGIFGLTSCTALRVILQEHNGAKGTTLCRAGGGGSLAHRGIFPAGQVLDIGFVQVPDDQDEKGKAGNMCVLDIAPTEPYHRATALQEGMRVNSVLQPPERLYSPLHTQYHPEDPS